MSDQILYNYAAMDDAFEEMMGIGKQIQSDVDTLMGDAEKLLAASEGAMVDGYIQRAGTIREDIELQNTIMNDRAKQLNDMFADMGVTDQKLGDGI